MGSVLLSDEIERYVTDYNLISPFYKKNLKPASYQLTAGGKQYAVGGILKEFKGKGDLIEIPPFNVAIIETNEFIKMPKELIARWNIRVTLAYQGLLWVGGPQVDPGYEGPLFCPIYNLSNETVRLKQGEKIATIDFTKTTMYKAGLSKEFEANRGNNLTDYNYKLKSALFTEVSQRIGDIDNRTEKKISEIRNRLDAFIYSVITLVGIILTVISVLITYGKNNDFSVPVWILVSLIFSYVAVMFTIYFLIKKDDSRVKNEKKVENSSDCDDNNS